MSSVAYAPEEIFLVLSSPACRVFDAPWIGSLSRCDARLVASYRRTCTPTVRGGDYEVVTPTWRHAA